MSAGGCFVLRAVSRLASVGNPMDYGSLRADHGLRSRQSHPDDGNSGAETRNSQPACVARDRRFCRHRRWPYRSHLATRGLSDRVIFCRLCDGGYLPCFLGVAVADRQNQKLAGRQEAPGPAAPDCASGAWRAGRGTSDRASKGRRQRADSSRRAHSRGRRGHQRSFGSR